MNFLLYAAIFSHLLCRIVGMSASAVPVARDRLWIERHNDAKLFGYAMQNVTTYPQMIAGIDAFARTNLKLPLRGHYFSVYAAYFNASEQASLVVSLYYVAAERLVGAN